MDVLYVLRYLVVGTRVENDFLNVNHGNVITCRTKLTKKGVSNQGRKFKVFSGIVSCKE